MYVYNISSFDGSILTGGCVCCVMLLLCYSDNAVKLIKKKKFWLILIKIPQTALRVGCLGQSAEVEYSCGDDPVKITLEVQVYPG